VPVNGAIGGNSVYQGWAVSRAEFFSVLQSAGYQAR